jgi:CRISPR-associated protein Cas2
VALNDTRDWIIAYDIADPRRLGHVHRFMIKKAIPLQRSVFTAKMTSRDARRLCDELAAIIDKARDDVRMYPLPSAPQIARIGRLDIASSGVFLA